MTSWDEHCRLWISACALPGNEADQQMQSARKRVAENSSDDWQWLVEALTDPERKWFVAKVFESQSMPRRLLTPMLHAGVMERNPSFNKYFIEPCVSCFGARRVLVELLGYLESGSDEEKAGAASALYWVGGRSDDNLLELHLRIRNRLLLEFVNNPDLNLRRRIIPMLQLKKALYPKELRPLVSQAVKIARKHPDEYIRHRVKVQLGVGGPLMPIPDG
jgi:hypothetical protein